MSERLCVGGGDPHTVGDDGFACVRHAGYAVNDLATIADLTEAARDVARGQSRRGPSSPGSGGGRLELNLSAAARLDAVQNALVGWCRVVADEWRLQIAVDAKGRPMVGDPLAVAATWLSRQMGLLRGREFVADAMAEIADGRNVMVGLIDGGAGRHYLGPCGAVELHDASSYEEGPESVLIEGLPCDGDVYARHGAGTGRCRTCGAEHDVAPRRVWLDDTVRGHAFRAAHIADAFRLPVDTIRSWHMRGKLWPAPRPEAERPCRVDELWHDERDRPLFLVGEVLDLARVAAERRAAAEAKRALREAEAA